MNALSSPSPAIEATSIDREQSNEEISQDVCNGHVLGGAARLTVSPADST